MQRAALSTVYYINRQSTAQNGTPQTTLTTLSSILQNEVTHLDTLASKSTGLAESTYSSTSLSLTSDSHFYAKPEPEIHAGIYIYGFCLVLIPTATILGNLLVIVSVLRFKALHSAINFLILGLAVADLLVALFVMPYAVYVYVQGGYWFLGALMCDIYSASDVSCSTASILLLAVISFDRYRAVSRPIQYSRQSQNIKRVVIIILVIWVISFAIASPIVLGVNYRPVDANPYECRFYNPLFSIFSSLLSFVIPCVIVLFVYIRIMMALREREKAAKIRRFASQQIESGKKRSTTQEREDSEEAGELVAGPDENDLAVSSTPRSSLDSLSETLNVMTNDFVSEGATSNSRKSSEYEIVHQKKPMFSRNSSIRDSKRQDGLGNRFSMLKKSLRQKKRKSSAPVNPVEPAWTTIPAEDIFPAIFRQFSRRRYFRASILSTNQEQQPTLKQPPTRLREIREFKPLKKKQLAILRRKSDSAATVLKILPTRSRKSFFIPNDRSNGFSSTETDNETTLSTTPNPTSSTTCASEQLPSNSLAATTTLTMAAVPSVSSAGFRDDAHKLDNEKNNTKAFATPATASISKEKEIEVEKRNHKTSYSRSNTNPMLSMHATENTALLNDGDNKSYVFGKQDLVIQNLGAKEVMKSKSPSVTFQLSEKELCSLRRGSSSIDLLSECHSQSVAQIPLQSSTVDSESSPQPKRSQNSTDSISCTSQMQQSQSNASFKQLESKRRLMSNSKQNGSTTALAVRMVKKTINRKESSLKRKVNKSQRKEKRATKTLGIVVGIFLICWVPFFSINIINAICVQFKQPSCEVGFGPFFYSTWIGYMNSFMNPVIYTIFNTEFRRAFKSLIMGRHSARSSNNRARRI